MTAVANTQDPAVGECPCLEDNAQVNNFIIFFSCRKRCNYEGRNFSPFSFDNDLVGLQPLSCPAGTIYVSSVRFCAEDELFQSSDFIVDLIASSTSCPGGTFQSLKDLQRLRFCNRVQGSIIIRDADIEIDPTIFWDIEVIEGCCIFVVLWHAEHARWDRSYQRDERCFY